MGLLLMFIVGEVLVNETDVSVSEVDCLLDKKFVSWGTELKF